MRNVDSRTNGGVLEDDYIVAYMKHPEQPVQRGHAAIERADLPLYC